MGIACRMELAFLNRPEKLAGYEFYGLVTYFSCPQ